MSENPNRAQSSGEADMNANSPQRRATDELFSLVYEELRRLASYVRKADPGATINSTALVHEAWLKLKDSPFLTDGSVTHFKAVAARAMRQVLIDEARRRTAVKRGGVDAAMRVLVDDVAQQTAFSGEELVALDQALQRLAAMNARQAQVVECRFFGGLSVEETASVLKLSVSSVERDWRSAKAWLARAIRLDEGLP